jgi:hypothetical protein
VSRFFLESLGLAVGESIETPDAFLERGVALIPSFLFNAGLTGGESLEATDDDLVLSSLGCSFWLSEGLRRRIQKASFFLKLTGLSGEKADNGASQKP